MIITVILRIIKIIVITVFIIIKNWVTNRGALGLRWPSYQWNKQYSSIFFSDKDDDADDVDGDYIDDQNHDYDDNNYSTITVGIPQDDYNALQVFSNFKKYSKLSTLSWKLMFSRWEIHRKLAPFQNVKKCINFFVKMSPATFWSTVLVSEKVFEIIGKYQKKPKTASENWWKWDMLAAGEIAAYK